ncbi:MAG: carbohydrate ABC transporter substrate-binding protein [Ruminococcaceae bacterium]|nr:carbohydrate ABC transporter substrate-binding protein [Oscillospiraceae bacterium]
MKTKKLLSASAAAIMLLSMLTACSQTEGGGSASTEPTTTAPPSTMAEEQQSQADEIVVKDFELENKEITFLASWARNPANGKNKDVAIELFQTRFGGTIKDMVVGDSERYDRLATLVSTGSSPDFFSAADMDAFPKGAINQMFQPLDNYIDFNDEWFGSRKSINDPFVYNGKHYVSVINPEVDVLMVYNKAVLAENGLTDPADLLKEGNWNWTTCKQLMNEFCDKSEDNYATDGWWITKGFCNSTGVPFIGMEDGMVVNNLRDPLIAEAQDFLNDLNREEMAYPVWDFGWVANARNVGDGKTLFFPVGYWALTEVATDYGLANYGNIEDVGFVPIPKCPSADAFYIPARVTGYMLCSGAPNPEGFACMMYCEAAANDSEEAEQITKEQYFNEYGWTEDMWEMRNTIYDMLDEHPVFDFSSGISEALFDALDNPTKDAYHNGASWTQTRETILGSVQSEVDKANSALES